MREKIIKSLIAHAKGHIEKHKANAASRYQKQLEARKARKAKPEEEATEEGAETAEAPAEETAAE